MLRLDVNFFDYTILAIYFAHVDAQARGRQLAPCERLLDFGRQVRLVARRRRAGHGGQHHGEQERRQSA